MPLIIPNPCALEVWQCWEYFLRLSPNYEHYGVCQCWEYFKIIPRPKALGGLAVLEIF